MRIGADTWIYRTDGLSPGNEETRKRRVTKHRRQRADNGWSEMDFWGGDHFIIGVIAGMARRFAEHGVGYPGGMTEESWNAILKRIYEPMEAWLVASETGDDTTEHWTAANKAVKLFSKNWAHFWD